MNPHVESYIQKNIPWSQLPESVQQQLGNSQKEYDKCVVTFSVRNQVRFRGSLVRHVRKDEKKYYADLIDYSRRNLMLFPYHLSDVVIKSNPDRVTPFNYYSAMLDNLMAQEKSYDSLPNFTAADCLRLMGIGRNQYIDLMNMSRSSKRFGFFRRSGKELLPVEPVKDITILPWWIVQLGFVTEEDMKLADKAEHVMVDQIIDNGPCPVGHLNYDTVLVLYLKGLIYFDVPIAEDDAVIVPPLEGFVMNRTLGDYFETLLYKIFVSIDEHTTLKELANVLEIDVRHVQDAVSLYCRLGFARKKNAELDNNDLHPSWYEHLNPSDLPPGSSISASRSQSNLSNNSRERTPKPKTSHDSSDEDDSLLDELNKELENPVDDVDNQGNDTDTDFVLPDKETGTFNLSSASTNSNTNSSSHHKKKIAFLFDSKLTAYLMMGNLSPGLKTHAVTMFEVGKLSDESMDSLVAELEKIQDADGEGEAARYFSHALTLRDTILFLRYNEAFKSIDSVETANDSKEESNNNNDSLCLGLDLIRCESLQSLDPSTATRLLNKNYSLLVSMAPLMNEIRPDVGASNFPPHLGPAIPELSSIWFKMYIYHVTQNGPPSLLLPKGSRPTRLPKVFNKCTKLLVTSWGNEPSIIPVGGALSMLLDALQHSPVLIQAYAAENINSNVNTFVPVRNVPFEHPQGVEDVRGGGPTIDGKSDTLITTTLPFPIKTSENKIDRTCDNDWAKKHPCLEKLTETIDVEHACGYITLINLSGLDISGISKAAKSKDTKDVPENGKLNKENAELLEEELDSCLEEGKSTNKDDKEAKSTTKTSSKSNWVLLDVNFGIPLFSAELNKCICERIVSHGLLQQESLTSLSQSSRNLCLRLLEFIADFQDLPIVCGARPSQQKPNNSFSSSQRSDLALPTRELFFDGRKLHVLN